MDELSPNFVPGDGPQPCHMMIVGEAPGADEDAAFKPFVGRAGKLLEEALLAVELKRADIYITNVVKQRPPNNRRPTETEILAHLPYLGDEIKTVQPHAVLLLGNTALHSLTQIEGGIMSRRGKIASKETIFAGVADVYATIHPSAALRSRDARFIFFADVRAFAKMAAWLYMPSGQGAQ